MSEKKYGIVQKSAVLALAVIIYETSATTPALGEISKAFPDVSVELVKQIAALPNLMLIVFALLPGVLERFISKRTLVFIGMALLLVGALPAFFGGMTFILFTRVVFGAGLGLLFPLASSIIQYLFEGKERDTMMGLRGAVGAVAGVALTSLGGILASMNWRYCFLELLLVIPMAILVYFKLPEPEIKPAPVVSASAGTKEKSLAPMTFVISTANVLYNIVMFSFITNVAIVMLNDQIGDAVQAGVVLSTFTVTSFFAGLSYGQVTSRIFKKYTVVMAVILVGLSFVIFLNAKDLTTYILGSAVFGFGFGTYNPEVTIRVMSTVKQSAASTAVGVYIACQGVGQFISPIILAVLTSTLGLTGSKSAWVIAAYTLLIGAALLSIVITVVKPKPVAVQQSPSQ